MEAGCRSSSRMPPICRASKAEPGGGGGYLPGDGQVCCECFPVQLQLADAALRAAVCQQAVAEARLQRNRTSGCDRCDASANDSWHAGPHSCKWALLKLLQTYPLRGRVRRAINRQPSACSPRILRAMTLLMADMCSGAPCFVQVTTDVGSTPPGCAGPWSR